MKKKKIILIVITLILVIALVVFLILKNPFKKNDGDVSGNSMDKKIDQLVSDGYLYYLLSSGPIPTDGASVEVDGVTYEYVNIAKLKTINDVSNLVNGLFTEELREDRESKIFDDRTFLELENGLYVSYNKDNVCDITNVEGLKDYTYEKVSKDMYRIITTFGDNNVVNENDNWYVQSDIFKCINNTSEQ